MYFNSKTRVELVKEMAEFANEQVIPVDEYMLNCLTDGQKKFNITLDDFCYFISESPYEAMMIGCGEFVPSIEVLDVNEQREHEKWIKTIWDVVVNIMIAEKEEEEMYESTITCSLEHDEFPTWESLEKYLLENGHTLN